MLKRKHVILVFFSFCLAATLFIGATSSAPYDPWYDPNDDGIIDLFDVVALAARFGTTGTPINKTELILQLSATVAELQAKVEALETRIPKKGYLSISCTAFIPKDNSVNYENSGWLYNHGTGRDFALFLAPVQLPHGVKVSKLTFYWYDGGDASLHCYLKRQNPTGFDDMAEAFSPEAGAPGAGFSHDITILDNTVDNSQYAYLLMLFLPETVDYYFKHAIIEYEYPA